MSNENDSINTVQNNVSVDIVSDIDGSQNVIDTGIINSESDDNGVDMDVIHMYKYSKRKIYELINDHEREVSRLKRSLEKFDKIMYKKCKHDWERDPPEMYSLSSYTCKKCHLGK